MKKIYYTLIITGLILVSSCEDDFLDRSSETSITADNFFNTEDDLSMYVYSMYDFPDLDMYNDDASSTTDNAAYTGSSELKTMMTGNPTSSTITDGWDYSDWESLRNINYFLEYADKADVTEDVLNNYIGLARFFRAQFYMDKVKRYSDVPWYSNVIESDDEDYLTKARDPRDTVVTNLFKDYAFAAEHVDENQGTGAVDKWTVMTYYARNALYEGTYRKYHSELELESTADDYIELAVTLADSIMEYGGFSVYSTGDTASDYASLFTSSDLSSNTEVIFPVVYEDDVIESDFWAWYFGDYEGSPSKDLLQSYLMADGSYYTDQSDYETKEFVDEFENRDPRLYQTYAYPGWELVYTETYATGSGTYVQKLQKNFSGYHQIKGFINETDESVQASVDVPVLRYAEVLLIYAEARAELGKLTQDDLDKTINVLRDRVGMPHMSLSPSTDAVQAARYSNISTSQSAELLEIRRERRVELAMEGYRYDDIMRYGAGDLLENEPIGLYFPGLGKYDLTGDGIEDIILISDDESIPTDKETNSLGETLDYYKAGEIGSDNASVYLSSGTSGNVVTVDDRGTFVDPKYYYRPVPASAVAVNKNLTQIFDWE